MGQNKTRNERLPLNFPHNRQWSKDLGLSCVTVESVLSLTRFKKKNVVARHWTDDPMWHTGCSSGSLSYCTTITNPNVYVNCIQQELYKSYLLNPVWWPPLASTGSRMDAGFYSTCSTSHLIPCFCFNLLKICSMCLQNLV